MYLKHFAIKQYPFQLTPDTEFSCNYGSHHEALNTLLFSLGEGEGIVKIIGEIGLGKTFLCRELLNCLDEQFVVIYLPNPSLTPQELKQTIFRELQSQMPITPSIDIDLTQLIFTQILHCHQQKKRVVIIVDEAQALSDEALETLRLLTNLETESHKLLQIVLFAQPELKQRLMHRSLRQFNQRITFSHELTGLALTEMDKYLVQRLLAAGHHDGELFSRAAKKLLHRTSRGVPRIINILAHKAMLAAYGKGLNKVDYWSVRKSIADSKELVNGYSNRMSLSKITLMILSVILLSFILFILYRI